MVKLAATLPPAFFHASDSVIKWPTTEGLAAGRKGGICKTPVLGLFANSFGEPLKFYGRNLYKFTLKPTARSLVVSNKIYCLIRLSNDYRAGVFDTARRAGCGVISRRHAGGDTSLIVLNLSEVNTWHQVDF